MSLFANSSLEAMIGAIRLQKPNATPAQCTNWLNWRVQQLIDMRTVWTGLIGRGVLNVPAAYTTGTVTTTIGSTTVTGQSTLWPINDVVNTTLSNAVGRPGVQLAVPASMANIVNGSLLYIGGANPEIVAVTQVLPQAFQANFTQTHSAADPLTQSSLAGQQFRPGNSWPIYTVLGIKDHSTMIIDIPWGGPVITAVSYAILKMYYTFATDLKSLMSVVDPIQGIELLLHYPLEQLNWEDPQRASVNFPQYVVDHSPDAAGNAVFELWPAPANAYTFYFTYYKQWPDMQARGDTLPPFMTPSVIIAGAIADALRTRIITGLGQQDQWYDPQAAQIYEGKFLSGANSMASTDNDRYLKDYSWIKGGWSGGYPGGATFDQSHDRDVFTGNW